MPDVDVFIIGGGTAVLPAAFCLSRVCYKPLTLVLEATETLMHFEVHMHMLPIFDLKDPKDYHVILKSKFSEQYQDYVTFCRPEDCVGD
jgi:thioredoxin reductase